MIRLKFEELTQEQKLGMTFNARPLTEADLEFTLTLVKKRIVGSIQVPANKPDFMKRIREVADYPVILVCDTETGFPGSDKQQIPLMTLSACNKPEYYEVFAKAIVNDAKNAGFNATWGPVIDTLSCRGPARVYRSFSDNTQRVCEAAEAMCKVYKRNGYMSCGKHYPSAKSSPYDSHMAPSETESDLDDIMNRGLVPYKYLMERGLLPSIMTSHRIIPKIDPEHAGTISPKVQRIIRDMGWDGVCWSDSFAMMAILQKYGEENVQGLAVQAGNDIVLPNYRTPTEVSWGYLVQNYKDGLITDERLDEAARRVVTLMNELAEIPGIVDVFTEEDQVLYDSIARESVTAICDEGVCPALDSGSNKLFVIMTPLDFKEEDELFETNTTAWYYPKKIAERIEADFPDARVMFMTEYPDARSNVRVLNATTKADEVIFVTYCETRAYLGTDCMTRRAEVLIDSINLAGKLAAVVHFGNPFALEPLMHLKRAIFGYIMPDAQLYAIDALAGKIEPHGNMPFNIELK